MRDIDKAIAQLVSSDPDACLQGLEVLDQLEWNREDALRIVELAGREFPTTRFGQSINGRLLQHFWRFPDPSIVLAIERIYDKLENKAEAPERAVRALMNMETVESVHAVVRLLGRPSSRRIELGWPFYIPVKDAPDFGLALFPGLFAVIPNSPLKKVS